MYVKQYTKIQKVTLAFLIVIVIIMLGVFAGLYISDPSAFRMTSTQVTENNKITLEKFIKIEIGMKYEEVVDIIGEEGILSAESSYGTQDMKIYSWYAMDGISNATFTFINGGVKSKSQIGLDK